MARCTQIITTGDRCREQRLPWLWLVQEDGALRMVCTAHLPSQAMHRVSAVALREWMCRGADGMEAV